MASVAVEAAPPSEPTNADSRTPVRTEGDSKGRDRVTLILPTFNERDSLRLIHAQIESALVPYSHEIIVVDDNSPDGTADEVRRLAESQPYRLLLRPRKSGLASAVLDGIRIATGTVIAVMDADGSHPPERLPALLDPIICRQAELTVGSRWAPGGREVGLDGVRRKISRAAAMAARRLTPVGDPMSGYFAVRRTVLERATLTATGFKVGLEVFAKCRANPVIEVPIDFGPRLAGESKLTGLVILSYVRQLERLYMWKLRQSASRNRRRAGTRDHPLAQDVSRSSNRQTDPTRFS